MKTHLIFISVPIVVFHSIRVGLMMLLYFITHPFQPLVKERPTPPKCLQDPKHGTHKYITVNGIKLHFVEKGDQSKPLMVFLHGFPEFWYSWRHQLQAFSNDYWCIAVDLRGYGESDKPSDVAAYRIRNILDDVKELVLAQGREKFTLIGHDWGALLVWSFVDLYGDMIEKFVAIGGHSPQVFQNLLWTEWWQFVNSWYIFFFQCPILPEITMKLNDFEIFDIQLGNRANPNPNVTQEDIDAYKYTFTQKDALTHGINYYRANFFEEIPQRVVNDTPKGLYILGENDIYVSKATLDVMPKTYEGLQTALMKGARHFAPQEYPEEVNKLIKEFL